jgi:uncharacterized protein involved in exopolysaccharide biosynthesis
MAKYAEVLFRHRIRFAALLLLPVVLGASVAVLLASYRASATLGITDPSAFGASFLPAGWSANQTPAQNLADNMSQVVKTAGFQHSLSSSLSASGSALSAGDVQQAMASNLTSLKVAASGSHLVTLTYNCPRPSACAVVLASIIDSFRSQLNQVERDQAAAATTFWNAQLTDAEANLTTAQAALQAYVAANPTADVSSSSTDPKAIQLVNSVQLWRTKVLEAHDGVNQAQYIGTASARFIQAGTTLVDAPHMTSSRFVGDRTSLVPAVLVLIVGLAVVGAYAGLLAWSDRTAGDPRALERRLGVPVVATIPKLARSSGY